jgi:hypothetical protein
MVTKVDGVPASGGLPALPTGLSQAEPDEKAKYNESIQKVLSAFENRSQIPWFKMAAAFADPGRTGTFGEAFGKAMGAVAQSQEEDRARELPIAQMRAQLAGQQYEMSKEEKAYAILARDMGFQSPQQAQQALQSGQGVVGMGSRFSPETYMSIARFSPKIAETYSKAAGMDIERTKVINEGIKTGIELSKLYKIHGKDAVDYALSSQGINPSAGSGQSAPLTGQTTAPTTRPQTITTAAGEVPVGDDGVPTTAIRDSNGNVVDIGVTEDPKANKVIINGVEVTRPSGASNTQESGSPQFGYENLGNGRYRMLYNGQIVSVPKDMPDEKKLEFLAEISKTHNKIYQDVVAAANKPWQEKQDELLKYDNNATTQNLGRIDQILKLVKYNPRISGMLQSQENGDKFRSVLNGTLVAAQEGIKAGNYGQISLPIEKFMQTANLNKEERAAVGELTRLLSQEFMAGMKANRGLLGVNPTDNDARLYQATMASTLNLPDNIYAWAQGRRAEYQTANEMYKGFVSHLQKSGTGSNPNAFFINPNSPYHTATQNYASLMSKIYANSPGVQ